MSIRNTNKPAAGRDRWDDAALEGWPYVAGAGLLLAVLLVAGIIF